MSVIPERPRNSLAELIADYPTASCDRAPGLLHAIAQHTRTPMEMLQTVRFLTRVADEVNVFEPNKRLRDRAIEFLILYPIRRMTYDAAHGRVLQRILWFFARSPQHYWHCIVDQVGGGPETRLVQPLVKECWTHCFAANDPIQGRYMGHRDYELGSWRLPLPTMLNAMINCRMDVHYLRIFPEAIVLLFSRVMHTIQHGHVMHSALVMAARKRLLGNQVIDLSTMATADAIVAHYSDLAMITDLAECLAPSTDSAEHWEAQALMTLVGLQLNWQRLLAHDTPAV